MKPRTQRIALALAVVFSCGSSIETTSAAITNKLFAIQNRASTPNFQLFLNLRSDSSTAMGGPLYGPAGGVYAADFSGTNLYVVELENGGTDDYLGRIPYEGAQFGFGSRVAPSTPIGFSDVEGLAAADGTIYATSLDYAGHQTRLITINPTTGAGSLVGVTGTDILLVGLAYDPVNGIMYGAGIPFASEPQAKLYHINRQTGAATAIGPLGAAIQTLSWDVDLGLIGAFEKMYQINPTTGAATQIGTSDFTDGNPGTFNGIYALAAFVPPATPTFQLRSIGVANNSVVLSWDSMPGETFQVESRGPLTTGSWTNAGGNITATGNTTAFTNADSGSAAMQLFRVRKTSGP